MLEKKGALLLRYVNNEQGILFPFALIFLLLITTSFTYYIYAFKSQVISYDALESSYISATISIIEKIGN